jgi:hypothetical protein
MIKAGDILVHKDSGMWYAAVEDKSNPISEQWLVYRPHSATDADLSPRQRALNVIADTLQADINFVAGQQSINEDTIVMPRHWPTVGVLRNWIKALRGD